jgi:two-component system sensor histidine kinase/response regulator
MTSEPQPPRLPMRMTSLRMKLIVFISVIIVAVCSGLSWYVVNQQVNIMVENLMKTGQVIVENLAHNSRFPLIAKDAIALTRVSDGAMRIDEVVYVVMTDNRGVPLVSKSKGVLHQGEQNRNAEQPVFPAPRIVQSLLSTSHPGPIITSFKSETLSGAYPDESSPSAGWPWQFADQTEILNDFAIPVRQRITSDSSLGPLVLEQQEDMIGVESSTQSKTLIHGIVQVGISNENMIQQVNELIWNIVLITVLIIVLGIIATTLLANRIIHPLRSLAEVAKEVSAGNFSVSLAPTTQDEVGELTTVFNTMTQAIRDREQAISAQVSTITKHANKLTTLNQTGSAIASHLDLNTLLSTVLQLLIEKVGFTHMLIMLYDRDQGVAYGAQTAGIAENLDAHIQSLFIPIHEDGTLHADLLLHGKAFVISDIEDVQARIHPKIGAVLQALGVTSFVCAPLKSQQHIMGFITADSTPETCTQEDLELLITIANTVGVAIDNARAYQQLEQLNITLEQRVEERTHELTEANVKLQELDQLKSVFVTIVSHELRTPMTSVKGLVENMLEGVTGELSERQTFYLSRVRANVERLTRMINDLLDLSRIEAGRMDLMPVSLSIPELVSEVTESLQDMATEHGLILKVNQIQEISSVRGDVDKMGQVLTNLVHNAIKFTPPSGTVQISLSHKNSKWVQVCVADTGCGVAQDELENIFERFYRSPSGPHQSKGAGLGLAISKSLVELHGGQIWVESIQGTGTHVFFTVPVAGQDE